MSKYSVTISSNGDYKIGVAKRPNNLDLYMATIMVSGTWGGGTIAWKVSPDGGTTKLTMKDASGTAYASTADDNFTINLGNGDTESPQFYASLTGATSPSLTITVFDNL